MFAMFALKLSSVKDIKDIKLKFNEDDWEKFGIKINYERFLESNDKVLADMTFSKEDVLAKYEADESLDRDKWLKLLDSSKEIDSEALKEIDSETLKEIDSETLKEIDSETLKEIKEWVKRFRWTTWNKTYNWFVLRTRAGCTKSCVEALKNIEYLIVLPFWCCFINRDESSLSKHLIRKSIIAVKNDTDEYMKALQKNAKFQDSTGEQLDFDMTEFQNKPIYDLRDFVFALAEIYGTLMFTHLMKQLK